MQIESILKLNKIKTASVTKRRDLPDTCQLFLYMPKLSFTTVRNRRKESNKVYYAPAVILLHPVLVDWLIGSASLHHAGFYPCSDSVFFIFLKIFFLCGVLRQFFNEGCCTVFNYFRFFSLGI